MRKLLSEKAGVNAELMTYEQLLVLIVAECGEFAVGDFLKSRYEFPTCRDEPLEEFRPKTWEEANHHEH